MRAFLFFLAILFAGTSAHSDSVIRIHPGQEVSISPGVETKVRCESSGVEGGEQGRRWCQCGQNGNPGWYLRLMAVVDGRTKALSDIAFFPYHYQCEEAVLTYPACN